jgi:hypothetical protein
MIDALLACPTTIPISNFYFTKCNGQENRRASEEEAPASTAQNSRATQVNHSRGAFNVKHEGESLMPMASPANKEGESLLTTDSSHSNPHVSHKEEGESLSTWDAPAAKEGESLISLNAYGQNLMIFDHRTEGGGGCSAVVLDILGRDNLFPRGKFITACDMTMGGDALRNRFMTGHIMHPQMAKRKGNPNVPGPIELMLGRKMMTEETLLIYYISYPQR